MQIFQSIDEKSFNYNNRKYVKNFIVLKLGTTHIGVYSAYDSKIQLLGSTHYSEVKVDEIIYPNQQALMNVLSPLVFNKSSASSSANQNNTGLFFTNYQNLIQYPSNSITSSEVANRMNALSSFIISETQTPVMFQFNRTTLGTGDGITILKKYIFLFLGGKGAWGLNNTPVTAGQFKLLYESNFTPDDISNDANSVINALGEVSDGNFVSIANTSTWDFFDSEKTYYFSYIQDGVLYFVAFVGEPGLYGLGNAPFTEDDFTITTNSEVEPVIIPTLEEVTTKGNTTSKPLISTNSITANSFVKQGGTSSQFLKADGTIDVNTYATTTQLDGKVSDSIIDGVITIAPSQNAVFDSLSLKINSSIIGQPNGLATLDINSKVPLSQMNDALLGNVTYKGLYNGTIITSSPDTSLIGITLPNASTDNKGWYFIATASFNYNTEEYRVGDWIISNATQWDKVDNTDAVSSVNGKVGVVTVTKTDVGLSSVDNTSDSNKPISNATQIALNLKANLSGGNSFTGSQSINGNVSLSSNNALTFNGIFGLQYNGIYGGLNLFKPGEYDGVLFVKNTGEVSVNSTSPEEGYKFQVEGNVGLGTKGQARIYGGTLNSTTAFIQSRDLTLSQNLQVFAKALLLGDIGIVSTGEKLQVDGSAKVSGSVKISDAPQGNTLKLTRGDFGALFGNSSTEDGLILYNLSGTIAYQRWHGNGNITIGGVSDSGEKFQVNGTGNFTGEVKVPNATATTSAINKGQLESAIDTLSDSVNVSLDNLRELMGIVRDETYTGNATWFSTLSSLYPNTPVGFRVFAVPPTGGANGALCTRTTLGGSGVGKWVYHYIADEIIG